MKRFLIVNNIPTPYRTFMFNKLFEHGERRNIAVSVAFQAAREARRFWKPEDFDMRFPWFISTGWGLSGKPVENFTTRTWNADINRLISGGSIDWCLHSTFMSIGNWWAMLRAHRNTRMLFWCESNLASSRFNRGPGAWIKQAIIKGASALVCPGQRAVEYVLSLRPAASSLPVLWLPNIVDTALFRERVAAYRVNRDDIRREAGVSADELLILAVGRYTPSKGFDRLIDAAASVPGRYRILIYGGGEMEDAWRNAVRERGVEDRLRFAGQLPEKELVKFHAAADWFIHPALHDPSPLVTIEAMNAGLPMAVSIATGNSPEVVVPERNGFTFDSTQPEAVRAALRRIVETTPDQRLAYAAASTQYSAERFDPDRICSRFYDDMLALR